ncbi:MAG: Flp pilus assembly protein CpaB [Oligoflexia bacterium]|nr:Flp pilus assembly protein CpaB [Oligoflexia bacterium]
MNKKETVSLWISIFAGIFSAFLIFSYTQEKTKEISKIFGKQTSVVVAKQVIYEMQTVQENMVELVEIPEKFVQPGYARQIEDVVGLVALAPINKGEQILTNKVILPGPETGLSLQVSPGKRALSIPITKTRAVSHLLKPGDRVDMLVAIDLNMGSSQKRYIKTLLQDIVILATGMRVVSELPRIQEEIGGEVYIKNLRKETDFDTITIEASPSDAQKITYLLSTDPQSIFFTLRHPSDNEFISNLRQTELSDVLGGGINRAPAQRRPTLTR